MFLCAFGILCSSGGGAAASVGFFLVVAVMITEMYHYDIIVKMLKVRKKQETQLE
jgi:hypothetical protein